MTKAALRKAVLALPKRDRRALRNDLDLSLVENEKVERIPASHKRMLRERIAEHEANPSDVISQAEMDVFFDRLKKRLAAKRLGK